MKIVDLFFLPFSFLNKSFGRFLHRKLGLSIGKIQKTKKGEVVKSTTECRIANFLSTLDIEYQYEKPLKVWFFNKIHPDFYLPKYDMYIEYYGLLSHPKLEKQYKKEKQYKQRHYTRLRVTVIELDQRSAQNIEKALYKKLKVFVPEL